MGEESELWGGEESRINSDSKFFISTDRNPRECKKYSFLQYLSLSVFFLLA